jgi:tetratricopeptide (TPR) repeat protein
MNGSKHIAAVCVLLALAVGIPAAHADEANPPGDRAARCADLTRRAQSFLDAAEAEPSKERKMEAYGKSRDLALEAVALNESNADAHFIVFAAEGRLQLMKGAVPNPISLYKVQGRLDQVLELDPQHAGGLTAKGGLYRQLPRALGGDLDKAEVYLKRAIEQDPNAIGARIELAATYRDMGHPERCDALLETAIAIAEKQGKPHRIAEAEALRASLAAAR